MCAYDGRKLGLKLMRTIARERGGRCVSTEYVNASTRLEWECHIGHRWFAPSFDPERALVSTVRLSRDDDKSDDYSQAPPLTDQGLIARQADSLASR